MSSTADPGREPERRPVTEPPPLTKPPRGALTMRDMLVALGALVAVVVVVGGLSRSCSFAPTGPTVDAGRLPVLDAPAELGRLAPGVPFALRIPAVPAQWRVNSVGQDRVGSEGARAVRIGYLTPEGRYLRLLQSDASEEALLAVEQGDRPVAAQGVVEAGGLRWVVHDSPADEPVWIAEAPDAGRLLITGSADEAGYRALAAAATAGELVG